MDYSEILKNARECSGPYCKACPVCNGMACRTQVPGPGGKGTAATMLRNYQKWQGHHLRKRPHRHPLHHVWPDVCRADFCRPGGSHEAPLWG